MSDVIQIKYLNCKNLSLDKDWGIPDFRKKAINDFKFEKDKKLCLGSWLLLGELGNEEISYTKYNKPYVKGSSAHFNLSHSGDYAVCAFSDKEIGCDIEEISEYDQSLAEHCMQTNEIEDINQDKLKFFKYWTMKESYMKATGQGLNLEPLSFSIDGISDYHFYKIDIDPLYSCHVCSKLNNAIIKLEEFSF